MPRPVTLFTGQWADLPFTDLCARAERFGYDGLELACWGDHFEVGRADAAYCRERRRLLAGHDMNVWAISNHLVGQAVCDPIDERHRGLLPDHVWGDGDEAGVQKRAAEELIRTGEAAATLEVPVVNGFTGSSIWRYLYSFPPVPPEWIDRGFEQFAERFTPILDRYRELGVRFGLEVHPTEIAFDLVTTERAVDAVDGHPAFGFNYDPSHLAYQGVDPCAFLRRFADRIFHVHIKDVWWSDRPMTSGTFGGHLEFGDPRRHWDFRSPGRGRVDFESILRVLNEIGYDGPLSVEWEDSGMDREHGATEAAAFVRRLDFPPSVIAFDAAFDSSSDAEQSST